MAITHADLEKFRDDLKKYLDEKFEAHEKIEMTILDQFKQEINSHHKTLYGVNGSPGLHTEVDRLKGWKKWTGVALVAGLTKWAENLINHGH